MYRLTGCDGWPYPSQRSTVGGDGVLSLRANILTP
nr:MAG TPA: hypothetical protein [Caudoviricetes sp.]